MIGTTILHFRILEKLGEGGMGVVYKAEDMKLDRQVALKFLPPHLKASELDKARFMQEAKAAAALNHPNICSIIDIQEHDTQMFIVMEYVDGRTLRDHKAASLAQALDIGIQIADCLAAAHDKGIVHRDIKPENIMVRADGIVQIMDFGVAKLQGVSRLTQGASTIGTAGYMSPEQIQGNDADHRSDIFSLGVVLYELFTGRTPFRGAHETALAYEIVNVEPPPMSSMKPGIDEALERIVGRCLTKDPGERTQSARQVAIDLKRYKRDTENDSTRRAAPATGAPDISGSQKTAMPGRAPGGLGMRKTLVIGFGVLAIGCLIAGAWLFLGPHTEPVHSIVVLPFENVGANSDLEYLSDGVTEGIINEMSKTPGLRVIPRSASFRYKGSTKDPGSIGKELGVDAVLSGRVVERGNQLDLSLELINVKEFAQVWGQNYKRTMDDLITVQEEIAAEVRKKIGPAAVEATLGAERVLTTNPKAYRLYIQGKYFWNKRTAPGLDRAITYYNDAIAVDPNFALAHLGLAETYILQYEYADKRSANTMTLAANEALRSLELDNSLGQAHALLGMIREYAWDWKEAEREFKLAIEKAPEYATSYHWYYVFLSVLGRKDEAFSMIKKGVELDPYSPIILSNLALAYMNMDDNASAYEVAQKVLDIEPQFYFGKIIRADLLRDQGKTKEGIEVLDGISLSGLSINIQGYLAYGYGTLGARSRALSILHSLLSRKESSAADPVTVAVAYAGLGETDSTIVWLRKAADQKSTLLGVFAGWPDFRSIHHDPRYIDILRSMGVAAPGKENASQ